MELLAQLKDIKLPNEVSIWPLAYGWYVVLAIFLLINLVLLMLYVRHLKKTFVKRLILQRLNILKNNQHTLINHKNIFEELSMLLKQAALYVYPRHEVAGLQGMAWLQFLDKTLGEADNRFSQGPGKILISAPYQPQVEDQSDDSVVLLIETWVKKNL